MRYYLATNKIDVFHYGTINNNQTLETGQPFLYYYNTKEELITVLESYGQQYQEPIIIEDTSEILPPLPFIEPSLPE
jgi:hypothetical protein